MAEMLSPGVFTTEIDASTIVPTVSSSIGIFGGDFVKGPVGTKTLITSVADLISFYGSPTNLNYNDWYQAFNFLQYGNKLFLSRASNVNGSNTIVSGSNAVGAVAPAAPGLVDVTPGTGSSYSVGDILAFDLIGLTGVDMNHQYLVTSIAIDALTLDRVIDAGAGIIIATPIYKVQRATNGVAEAISTGGTATPVNDLFNDILTIENANDYAIKETSVAMSGASAKVKFIAKNPGAWSSKLDICVATPSAFNASTASFAFTGIALDDLFEYAPTGTEVGIVIRDNNVIVETFLVDFDVAAKDHNNKSTYIENVINTQSTYLFAKDNTTNTTAIEDSCASVNGVSGANIVLSFGSDSPIQADDLLNAYDIFSNPEDLDIDIVIANELDGGASAKTLVDARLDCIGFIGAKYSDVVGKKSATAVANLITWRKTGDINYDNMFLVACGNYKYQYDRYNDKYRWINFAGDIAGLRLLAQ